MTILRPTTIGNSCLFRIGNANPSRPVGNCAGCEGGTLSDVSVLSGRSRLPCEYASRRDEFVK